MQTLENGAHLHGLIRGFRFVMYFIVLTRLHLNTLCVIQTLNPFASQAMYFGSTFLKPRCLKFS